MPKWFSILIFGCIIAVPLMMSGAVLFRYALLGIGVRWWAHRRTMQRDFQFRETAWHQVLRAIQALLAIVQILAGLLILIVVAAKTLA